MVEKIKLTQEMLDSGKSFGELGFKFEEKPLPYSTLEEAALEFADLAYVIDDLGVVYKNYSYDMERTYVCLKYFSNLDVEGWDKETLWNFVGDMDDFDYHNTNGYRFEDMTNKMFVILSKRVERENSVDYKLVQWLDTLKDIKVDRTNEATEKIISLMDKVNEAEKKPVLTMFAKKDDRS